MSDQNATEYLSTLSKLMQSVEVSDGDGRVLTLDDAGRTVVEAIRSVKASAGKAMLIGNGGSASIASHIQNDLCKAVGMRTLVFNEQPLLMALANDHGYECVFERPIKLWASQDDLLFAISSSGQSENILRAVATAKEQGCKVITFSGFKLDNQLRSMGHLNFYVPSKSYGHVEITHSALLHLMADGATNN